MSDNIKWANSTSFIELKLLTEKHGYFPNKRPTKLEMVNWLVEHDIPRLPPNTLKRKSSMSSIGEISSRPKKTAVSRLHSLIASLKERLSEPEMLNVVRDQDGNFVYDNSLVLNEKYIAIGETKYGTLKLLSRDGVYRCINERIPFSSLHIEGCFVDNDKKGYIIEELEDDDEGGGSDNA